MKHQVAHKQHNSKHCFVCGLENTLGLKVRFYALENQELVALCQGLEEHQSYPNRLHGGVSAAILDETIGRVISNLEPNTWGVTVSMETKYLKPIPLNTPLKAVGRVTKNGSRLFEGNGEILLPDGTIAVSATAKYMKLPLEKISSHDFAQDEWFIETDNQLDFIELP